MTRSTPQESTFSASCEAVPFQNKFKLSHCLCPTRYWHEEKRVVHFFYSYQYWGIGQFYVRAPGLTDNDRRSGSSRKKPTTGRSEQRKKTLPETVISLRTCFRNAGSVLRQDRLQPEPLSAQQKCLLMMRKEPSSATGSIWSAERSALAADALRQSGHLRLRVHGESMLPALWPGEVVEIASCWREEVKPGEIVLARREGRLFLHRLVAPSRPDGFRLRGDSMAASDPQYPPDALLGKLVRGDDQEQGYLSVALSRALGALLCHCGPVRRLALKLHSRRKTSATALRNLESI